MSDFVRSARVKTRANLPDPLVLGTKYFIEDEGKIVGTFVLTTLTIFAGSTLITVSPALSLTWHTGIASLDGGSSG